MLKKCRCDNRKILNSDASFQLGGELKIGRSIILPGTILLSLLIIGSTVIGGIIVFNQIESGGVQEKWKYSGLSPNGYHQNSYEIDGTDADGTVYAREYVNSWSNLDDPCGYFVALDTNGQVKWRYGFNAYYPWLHEGRDGNFYFVDLRYASDRFHLDWTRGYKLASLDHYGNLRWEYYPSNGTISYVGAFQDGDAIARIENVIFNSDLGQYTEFYDELICISPNGTQLWNRTYNTYSSPFNYGRPNVNWNDTIIFVGNLKEGDGIDISHSQCYGMSESGSVIWNYSLEGIWGWDLGSGPVYYEAVNHIVNAPPNRTAYFNVTAFDTRLGTVIWSKTLQKLTGNQNESLGWESAQYVYTDGKGIIYCQVYNYSNPMSTALVFGLTPDGEILWSYPTSDGIIGQYQSGGLLLLDDNTYRLWKLDSSGKRTWEYPLDNSLGKPGGSWGIVLGQNGNIYVAQEYEIMTLEQSEFSTNLMLLTILIIFDLLILVWYVIYRKKHRKTKI